MDAPQASLRPDEGEPQGESPLIGQLSCVQCRTRKLRCDRKRPRCDRCVKQSEPCTYPGTRRRALGPRKTVKELEERIEELEGLLRASSLKNTPDTEPLLQSQDLDLSGFNPSALHQDLQPFEEPPMLGYGVPGLPMQATGELISLGLFESLPSFDIIDQLTALFFQNIHPGAPMLHEATYTTSLRLPPHMRPPMCLQYIVMATAAATSDTYRHLSEAFYQRARAYAEADEVRDQGETFTTVAHVQCWCLISSYECHVHAMFTRASTSLCRGVRIAQILKLHKFDGSEQDAPHSGLPPPRNRIEAEERRRTWWVVFIADRYLSSVTGWPSLVDERHIRTHLPSTEESYAAGTSEPPIPFSHGLRELEQGRGARLAPFAIRILAANELLHALDHSSAQQQLTSPSRSTSPTSSTSATTSSPSPPPPPPAPSASSPEEDEARQLSIYWHRHREIDAAVHTLNSMLPVRLHLARNPRSLDAILVHVCNNMAMIHLHRTALARMARSARDGRPPHPQHVAHSRARLLPAAQSILTVFRTAGDRLATAIRNPLLSFAASMAAGVFLDEFIRAGQQQQQQQQQQGVGAAGGGEGSGGGGDSAGGEQQQSSLLTVSLDSRQCEEAMQFLAQTLLFFGRTSPIVRANAYQLAMDMKRTGYDASMLDKVLAQMGVYGGSTSELRVPRPADAPGPDTFCPALTVSTVPGPEDDVLDFGLQGGFNYVAHGGGCLDMAVGSAAAAEGPALEGGVATSMLEGQDPVGLFAQLANASGGFFDMGNVM